MENGEVINWDRLCASLCQPHLPKTCNEKWWAPAVHQNPSPSFRHKLQAQEMVSQMKKMEVLGGWKSMREGKQGSSDGNTVLTATLPLYRTWRKHCWHKLLQWCQNYYELYVELDNEAVIEVGMLGEGREADFTKCFYFKNLGEI